MLIFSNISPLSPGASFVNIDMNNPYKAANQNREQQMGLVTGHKRTGQASNWYSKSKVKQTRGVQSRRQGTVCYHP